MRSSIVKGLTFKCVIWPYPLETNAKHCTYLHNQMLALQAPQDCWGQGLQQRGHAGLVCHGFRTTPRNSPVHVLPNQMHMGRIGTKTEKSTQLEKNLQVWGRHTYTQQERTDGTNSNIHVQTGTGERAEARRLTLLGAHCDNRTPGLALLHDTKRTGKMVSNPQTPAPSAYQDH